ncbi:MAG: glycosyltransferase family 2 protein, partial [Pseudobdellovibrionaceae bacterium]
AAEIYSLWPSVDAQAGYLLPRLSYHLGRWIRHGGWHPDYQLRLFNKKHSQWDGLQVHEKVKVKNQVKLKASILHWVFDNISDQVITNDKYSGLLAQNLSQQQRSFSIFKLITKPISKFIETYFWKRGFLDGLPGLIIAVSAAYSVFLKWAKLWEIQCLQKKI